MARTEEIVDVEDRPPLTTYTPVTHSSPDEPGKTVVLVVEDNDDARAYLRSRLEAEFNVWEAAEGKDALDQARERVPDIVVSDVMMPGMNGYELCRMLKSDIRTSHIPVVLLTALADRTDRIGGLETGADDYLVKPFDAQELVVRIRNLIATRRLLQERFTLHTTIASSQVEAESLDETFVRKCVETVIARCGDSAFDVEQFAEGVYLGRAQLHRKLKALTGHSPTDFIRILRLQRAKELLEKKAGTIAEIADSVGFANHSYFAKCFQEQFGALPSEMMRQRENGKPNHP
jgi:DNA-binding response OmpR family regulator